MPMARHQFSVTDESGNVIPFANVEVRREVSGQPLVQLFSDRAGTASIGNPIQADGDGFVFFHVSGGAYQVRAYLGGFERVWRYVAVGLGAETDAVPHLEIIVAQNNHPAAGYADFVCDGSADEVEINLAVQRAANLGIAAVSVLDGDYSLDGPVVMASNVALDAAEGHLTKLVASVSFSTTSGMIHAEGKTNFKVKGFVVDGRTNNKATNGIVCAPTIDTWSDTPCSDFEISDNVVKVRKGHSYHIWVVRGADFTVKDNQIDGGYTSADTFTALLSQEGIECWGTKRGQVINNRIKGVGNAGINLPSFTDLSDDSGFEDMLIADNDIQMSGTGILSYLYSDTTTGDAGGMKDCTIARNTVRDWHVNGIAVEILSVAGFGAPVPFHSNTIADNVVSGADTGQIAAARGLAFNNQRGAVGDLDCHSNIISGNIIANCRNANQSGFASLIFWKGFNFYDNDIFTEAAGSVGGPGLYLAACENFQVERNTIDGGALYSIDVQGCTGWSISGNLCRNWNVSEDGYTGIMVQALGGVPSTDGDLQGNRFETDTLTDIGSLIVLDATTDEINYLAPDNRYIGDGYVGTIVSNLSSNTFNRGVSAWSSVNQAAPDARYARLSGTNFFNGTQVVQAVDSGALPGPTITVDRQSASPAIADYLGVYSFAGRDSGGNVEDYARITAYIQQPTAGSEYGGIEFDTVQNGSVAARFMVGAGVWVAGAKSDPGSGAVGAAKLSLGVSGGNYITFAPISGTATYNFNMPTSAGTAGQALLSGGGGSAAQTWGNIPRILAASAVASATHTGTTAETTLATIAIPAGAMGANGRIEIEAVWGFSSGGAPGTRTVRHRVAGNSIHSQVCANTTQTYSAACGIANRNAANSQVCRNTASAGGWGMTSSAVQTFAIDTTAAQNVTLTCQLADAGDSAILHSYCVKLISLS